MFSSFRMPPRHENPIATAELAEIIAQQMAVQFPNLFAQWNQANNNNGTCKYKDFNQAKPLKFSGSEGATGLLNGSRALRILSVMCSVLTIARSSFLQVCFRRGLLHGGTG